MKFYLKGHDRINPVLQLLICLYPDEDHINCLWDGHPEGEYVVSEVRHTTEGISVSAQGYWGGRAELICPDNIGENDPALSEYIRRVLFLLLSESLGNPPAWGMLTGVKPSKLVRNMLTGGVSLADVKKQLEERYFVSESRSSLCIETGIVSQKMSLSVSKKDIEIYVGIPFCPAKCAYCSFVSNDVRRWGHMVEPYLETLLYEIKGMGKVLRQHNRSIKSLYIGGGTPSILSEDQLYRLISALRSYLDLSSLQEFTLEAGRPETITEEKLKTAYTGGVRRISINPQTMNESVLKGVGRLHTSADIVDCYRMARNVAPFEINMDLIAGLPADDDYSLIDSVQRVVELDPENITLHCMARKKGAPLRFGRTGELSTETVDHCHAIIRGAGYRPYYLYRQKYIAGGLENVGFAKPGTQCRYNIVMMEEIGDVAALGSGGVTKLVYENGSIERITNPKYPAEYIERREGIDNNLLALSNALEKD
ncbi:MAG: coproporphyrinogen dehydrogenase HemZ [Clostridiaceae bacterium]|nr:coproporphyrinogen dehydrogenase HemZ [Clostridiaceae bacterium]